MCSKANSKAKKQVDMYPYLQEEAYKGNPKSCTRLVPKTREKTHNKEKKPIKKGKQTLYIETKTKKEECVKKKNQ